MPTFFMSGGFNDSVMGMGDSISVNLWNTGAYALYYRAEITALYPPYSPTIANQSVSGTTSENGLANVDTYLAANPGRAIIPIGYGTNDSAIDQVYYVTPANYLLNMTSIISKILTARRVPVIPKIPYSSVANRQTIPTYNAIIENTLWNIEGVRQGPDLYTYFYENQDKLSDGIHPTAAGYIAAAELWAAAMSWAYER